MAPPLLDFPLTKVRFANVRLAPLFTTKSRTLPCPLIVTAYPVASRTVFVEIVLAPVRLIVPLQANVTVPPPIKALFRADSVALVITPPPRVAEGHERAIARTAASHNRGVARDSISENNFI